MGKSQIHTYIHILHLTSKRSSGIWIVENDVHTAVYSAINAEDGLQEICILVVGQHTVLFRDCSTGGRGLGCSVDKAVRQHLTATAKLVSGWVRVVMSKALLMSVTRDRHNVPVWDSCIRPQSYGCRPDVMVGVELRQGCCFADFFIMESSEFTPTGRVLYQMLSLKLQFFPAWILEKRLALRV